MAGLHRHADLAVDLEAADPGTVSRAWIDDHERPLARILTHARPWDDPNEEVIDGTLECAAVEHHLVLEDEHRRLPLLFALDELVSALAHDVPEQHGALRGVRPVLPRGLPRRTRREPRSP